jgi:putative chitinase
MFPGFPSTSGSGKIVGRLRDDAVHASYVAGGWPSLLEAMDKAQINTPRRVCAFLTTLCFESWLEYNVVQGGSNLPADISKGYTGRGYIQLTGTSNYGAAGNYLHINLMDHPELAQSLEYSARIATWYWTVARHCNELADAALMGKVNRAVGYPRDPDGTNDNDRCMIFAHAHAILTGETITVDCAR